VALRPRGVGQRGIEVVAPVDEMFVRHTSSVHDDERVRARRYQRFRGFSEPAADAAAASR
jgi:hypothetical protein